MLSFNSITSLHQISNYYSTMLENYHLSKCIKILTTKRYIYQSKWFFKEYSQKKRKSKSKKKYISRRWRLEFILLKKFIEIKLQFFSKLHFSSLFRILTLSDNAKIWIFTSWTRENNSKELKILDPRSGCRCYIPPRFTIYAFTHLCNQQDES